MTYRELRDAWLKAIRDTPEERVMRATELENCGDANVVAALISGRVVMARLRLAREKAGLTNATEVRHDT